MNDCRAVRRRAGLRTPAFLFGFACVDKPHVNSGDARTNARTADAPGTSSSLPPMPPCRSTSIAVCFHDTAFKKVQGPPDDPSWLAARDWLWFDAADDSIEVLGLGTFISTNLGQDHDVTGNTASFFRRRLHRDGVLTVEVDADDALGDSVEYDLRFRHPVRLPPEAFRATGQRASLNLVIGKQGNRVSVVPVSIAGTVRNRSDWAVGPREYNVALVADSLYELCLLPCVKPGTVKLTPWSRVVRKY